MTKLIQSSFEVFSEPFMPGSIGMALWTHVFFSNTAQHSRENSHVFLSFGKNMVITETEKILNNEAGVESSEACFTLLRAAALGDGSQVHSLLASKVNIND